MFDYLTSVIPKLAERTLFTAEKINNKKRSIYITVYTDLKIIFGGFSKKLHHCSIISMTIKFHIIQLNVVTNGKHIGNQPTTNQPRCRALGDVQVEIVQMQ